MKYPIYVIKDNKVGFSPQFIVQENDLAAKRGFGYIINNPQNIQNYAPSDYDLYKVGIFDVDSGEINSIIPEFITSGVNVYNEK